MTGDDWFFDCHRQDFSNTFRVGKYTCTMTVRSPERGKVGMSEAAWSPEMPPRGSFNSHMMAQYRAGRDALAAEVARALGGGNALIIETEGYTSAV
jgi:hypothetical protein